MNNENQFIYLDNNATTPLDPRVLEAMMPFLTRLYANASSTHKFGLEVNEAVKKARRQVADLIGAEEKEIVFTSGATEGINLALKGAALANQHKGNHIITLSTEHKAVLDTCEYLEKIGFDVAYLPVQPDGLLDLEVLQKTMREDTILVSVMYANNEIGVIQPIPEIAAITHSFDALFFTDATQAFGKIPISVCESGIDLMTFSGHKIYGPKGIGGLYVKNRLKLEEQQHGGGHERGLRSGTLNVSGIVGLGQAAEIAHNEMQENAQKIGKLRDYLETELLKIEGTYLNGNREKRLYNTSNIRFEGVDSDALISGLENIAVSNGSACTSTSIDPSHVLIALGLNNQAAFQCIRFSLGRGNGVGEIDYTIEEVVNLVESLRNMV
ncbi:MAG: cysteine desulfurase family protein [Microscillaceae bacterium]|nr:cysteine desulfurase family protein [Microscillaceae bacterium]